MSWQLKEQSRIKHRLLAEYLRRWFPILAQRHPQGERILYVDGFAGPGRYSGGELGSPLVALSVAQQHRLLPNLLKRPRFEAVWIFIEANKRIHKHLASELQAYVTANPLPPQFKLQNPILGEFDEHMTAVLAVLEEQRKKLAPAFVFVDPFGPTGFPLQTIRGIMGNRSCEVLIRLNYTRLANTFLQRPDMEARIRELYGCDGWQEARLLRGEARERHLLDLYQDQLRGQAEVGFLQSFKIVDETGHVAYFIFCTNNSRGFEEMKEAMWKIDARGLFRWRAKFDRQSEQTSFIPELANVECEAKLAEDIFERFTGTQVRVSDLEEFVRRQPIVLQRHLRPSLKSLEAGGRIVRVVKSDNTPRRKGTFPSKARVTFR